MAFEQSEKINQDEKNEEIEIMMRDNEQVEIPPIDPKDLNGLTGELVIKTHNFEDAKRRLKEVSEKKPEEFKIGLVKLKEKFWFLKEVGEHKVTGDEFNSRIKAINQHLINLHTKTYENNKEFGEVYNALEALDKDYIAVILTSINAIEEVSKHMREEIDTIKEVQKKTLENFQKFKQELKMDIDEISNESQMRHKEVSSLSKELKKTQIISFVSIAATLILGILIVSKVL
mgnify:CR=1 FL=1